MKSEYTAFTEFLTNDDGGDLSNSLDFWCCTPKYFFTPNLSKKLRNKDGLADPYHKKYTYKKNNYAIDIQPASIKSNTDGKYKSHFPGFTEELVEDILIKLLTKQSNCKHDPNKKETWVYFSLQQVRKELSKVGKDRNITQIKQAIKIMSLCVITLYEGDQEIWTGTILQDLNTVTRKDYLNGLQRLHFARLPSPISNAIECVDYRQFNYKRYMQLECQLSRYLFRRLVTCYTQASTDTEYNLLYSSVKNDSGLLEQATERDNRKKLNSSFKELAQKNIVFLSEPLIKKIGLKIIDVKYLMTASYAFEREQKAANKRTKNHTIDFRK